MPKAKTHWLTSYFSFFLSFLVAFPAHLWAQSGGEPRPSSEESSELSEHLAEVDAYVQELADAGKKNAPLALEAFERNAALLLHQRLLKKNAAGNTVMEWDLSTIDPNRPVVNPTPGLARRAAQVVQTENGFELVLPGFKWAHEIRLPDGVSFKSYDSDSDIIILLDSDHNLHGIEVSSLDSLLFRSAVPVFHLGKAPTVDQGSVDSVRFVKRRIRSADRSRVGVESALDRNPRTRQTIEAVTDVARLQNLKEGLEQMRPYDYHPDLASKIQAQSKDGKLWFKAGDIELLRHSQTTGEQQVVGIHSRLAAVFKIDLQIGPLEGMMHLASPESSKAVDALAKLRASSQHAVASIIKSPEKVRELYSKVVYNTVSKLPADAVNSMRGFSSRVLKRILETADNPDAFVDRFTDEERKEDFAYHEALVAEAEKVVKEKKQRSRFNPMRYNPIRRGVKLYAPRSLEYLKKNLPRRMQQLTTVLKKPLAAGVLGTALTGASLDYYSNHGQFVQTAIDALAKQWGAAVERVVPVFTDMDYTQNLFAYSFSAQVAVLGSVFLIAALFKPFAQKSIISR